MMRQKRMMLSASALRAEPTFPALRKTRHEQYPYIHLKRKPWLDACRALAVLFVIYGHQQKDGLFYFMFTSPVKVTMFFVISGYLFNPRDGKPAPFFKNLLLKLVLPWLILAIPQNLARELVKGADANYPRMLWDILSGKEFWYMPCCILAEALFFFVLKFARSKRQLCLYCALLGGLGFVLAHFSLCGFAGLNTALICQIYLLFGRMYRICEDRVAALLKGRTALKLSAAALIYTAMVLADRLLFSSAAMNIHANRYGLLPLSLASILLGCWLLFEAAKRIRLPRILCFIGENTLFFYMYEQLFRSAARFGLNLVKFRLPVAQLDSLLVCIAACTGLSIAALVINRFFPFAVGKRRKTA